MRPLMLTLPVLALSLFSACRLSDKEGAGADTGSISADGGAALDEDGDGSAAGEDCDDADASVYPGAEESCNGVDDDCDGDVDEGAGDVWYTDADADGYGDPSQSQLACAPPAGAVADATDCDDSTADAAPGAVEICDEIDNNCDGDVDEGVTTTFYADADADGWGDSALTADACVTPTGYADQAGDCDDAAATVNPWATERCDGVDNNCDGDVDEDSAVDASTWFSDADADGYGDPDASVTACTAPGGESPTWVANDQDCDDTSGAVHPAAIEVCNGVDDDCNGWADDDDPGLTGADTWSIDYDGDGYGASTYTVAACIQPAGYVADATDCDDTDALVLPGGTELCDGADNDCDGDVDEADADDAATWYLDADSDGYGDAATSDTACAAASGYVSDATDCDDGDSDVNPGATELCDGIDWDCDGDTLTVECTDCASILDAEPTSADGVYTIDLDGSGGDDPFDAYCDMTLDGGGWTLWWWYEAGTGMTGVTDVLGDEMWECDPSVDTSCYGKIPVSSPSEMMVLNQDDDWAVWAFDATTTSTNVQAAFTAGTTTAYRGCNDAWNPVAQAGDMTDDPYHCDENNNQGDNCDCFWYDDQSGVTSFYLDDDGGWAETAFGAGYDNGGGLGVDSLELDYRLNSTTDYSMWMYWR